jgi:hypothetical protein
MNIYKFQVYHHPIPKLTCFEGHVYVKEESEQSAKEWLAKERGDRYSYVLEETYDESKFFPVYLPLKHE